MVQRKISPSSPGSNHKPGSKTQSLPVAKARTSSSDVFGFSWHSTLLDAVDVHPGRRIPSRDSSIDGEVHVLGSSIVTDKDIQHIEHEIFDGELAHWQRALLSHRGSDVLFLQAKRGPIWLVRPKFRQSELEAATATTSSASSHYAVMRDRMGALWPALRDAPGIKHLGIFLHGCSGEETMACLLGMELGAYRFTSVAKGSLPKPSFKCSVFGASNAHKAAAQGMGRSMNLARHLVNTDAAKLNPKTYAEAVARWFKGKKEVSVEIWGPERLRSEGMHLHAGVGQGAVEQSHMVHIKYRPLSKPRFKAPVAFVGKGVTFDTGGLDIKPASGMRLMKKDMGGSASVFGIANWLVESASDVPCDLYLALAENVVDGEAFHPGDVLIARNGVTVEIHNTDAEGRLVMADVLDVAQTQSEKPCAVIDLSTLTGAMRVAVGTEIAGFFSTHEGLATLALEAGQRTGDPCWRLPLWEGYRSHLKSSFADCANASDSGFAGAITAALFLQKFIRTDIPWLHFDLYCWTDRPNGGLADIGGNGQGIQLVAALIDELSAKTFH